VISSKNKGELWGEMVTERGAGLRMDDYWKPEIKKKKKKEEIEATPRLGRNWEERSFNRGLVYS